MNNLTLTLVVMSTYFDQIRSGIKKEEYREIKPFWDRIFLPANEINPYGAIKKEGAWYDAEDFDIIFCPNYKRDRPTVRVECIGLITGRPKIEWSAPEYITKDYYILQLGEIRS